MTQLRYVPEIAQSLAIFWFPFKSCLWMMLMHTLKHKKDSEWPTSFASLCCSTALLIYSNNFLNGDFNAILFHVCALFSVLGMLQLPKWNWPFSSVCKLEIVYGGLILKFRGINMAKATFVCPIDAIFWYNREESLDKIEPESCLKRLAGSSSRKETNGGDGKARDYCTLK